MSLMMVNDFQTKVYLSNPPYITDNLVIEGIIRNNKLPARAITDEWEGNWVWLRFHEVNN